MGWFVTHLKTWIPTTCQACLQISTPTHLKITTGTRLSPQANLTHTTKSRNSSPKVQIFSRKAGMVRQLSLGTKGFWKSKKFRRGQTLKVWNTTKSQGMLP